MQEEEVADGAAAALDAVVLDAPPGSSSRLALVQSPTSGPQRLPPNLAAFAASPDALAAQTVEQLAAGALKLTAKIARTVNELEEGVVSGAKVVTYFVVEVNQMNFTWELRRRYSQFASFHEALERRVPPRVRRPARRQRARAARAPGCGVPTACDICDSTGASRRPSSLCPLSPRRPHGPRARAVGGAARDAAEALLLEGRGRGGEDIAERMVKLDGYLKSLLGTPALALSPPVCAFLDAVDVQSFRAQLKAGTARRSAFVPAGPI